MLLQYSGAALVRDTDSKWLNQQLPWEIRLDGHFLCGHVRFDLHHPYIECLQTLCTQRERCHQQAVNAAENMDAIMYLWKEY